jgi:hypothetical protein
MNTPDPEPVELSKLKPGPIRHESLPPELVEHVHAIYDVIGPYVSGSLEQFEIGFMRDAHPESEVAVWCNITAAWISYHEQYLDNEYLSDEGEKQLIAALIVISTGAYTGVEDVEALGVLPDVGHKLLACYYAFGEE